MKKWVILLSIFVLPLLAGAQILPFRNYSIEKGLSEAVVNAITQDNEGYMWIGTSYGLNRFDGIRFKNYYTKDGLLSNEIHSLLTDNENSLWIGTNNGVNRMRADSIYTLQVLNPLQETTVTNIFQDDRDEYWFATNGEGIWHLDRNRNLTQYKKIHGLAGNQVNDITEDSAGVLWFACRRGLTKLEDGNFYTYTKEQGLTDNNISTLAIDRDSSLWAGTHSGLCHISEKNIRCYTERDGLLNNRIESISTDAGDGLWLGTDEGASHFNKGAFTNYSVDEGLANNIIKSTYYDREGNIWFGTLGGGLSLFLGDYLKGFTVEQGLPNNMVSGITEDEQGNTWISTFGGGIAKFNGRSFRTYDTQDGLINDEVYDIKRGTGDRLLLATRGGFSVFRKGRFHNFGASKLPYAKIRTVLKSKQNNNIWLGTYGKGLIQYHNGAFRWLTEQDGLANNTVLSLKETADGTLWIATYGGISKLKDGVFTNYSIQDGLPNNGVLDITQDQSGNLWFATFGGIARYNDGTFKTINARDGLPDEVCYFIEQDDRGIFWIGTNKGIIRFDYKAFQHTQKGDKSSAFKLITKDQGLVSNEMNAGASFKDRRGNLWFGSVGGLIMLNPSREKKNESSPKIHIENIRVSGHDIPIKSHFIISGDDQNITIEFIGINFSAPEQVEYKYRLKNSGEDWQQTSQRVVRYSALMSGNYTFQVKAQNSDGKWSSETAEINFAVLAPFWMRWWFFLIIAAVAIGIFLFIYNYYQAMKMVDIERMRVRIASDLHDDVGSALTEIALQSDFLQTMDVDERLEDSIKQIGSQSRKIVTSLDDIVWSIDARNDTVGDVTDRMQDYVYSVLPNKEIAYHFDGDMKEKLDVSLKENLYLIFKEAINNIAKHSNASRVDITLSTDSKGDVMIVKDNGTDSVGKRKSGQGLRNMNMRAKRIGANITFNYDNGFEVKVKHTK